MRRLIAICLFIAPLCATNRPLCASPITYDIGPFTAFGAGLDPWLLAGTIVTDGKLGPLAISDVLSWDWSISDDGTSLVHFYSSGNLPSVGLGGMVGTTTALEMPFPADSNDPYLELINRGNGPNHSGTSELQIGTHAPGEFFNTFGSDVDVGWDYETSQPDPDRAQTWFPVSSTTLPTVPFIVATAVPEPATVFSLGTASLLFLAVHFVHKRK